MTRINTNVSSLNAQRTLQRSNSDLQEALTRLSTGLRINAGKDDPSGLIASETLRADIISVERAITNSERANQLIATADSALGQVSSLLNDIRGLVSEAANTGAMSDEQIAANQLQIDSSLEAIDRIAQVTQFQGRRLLDGSLDFITTGVDNTKVTDLQVDQANFGIQTAIAVSVDVVSQATQSQLSYAFGAVAQDVVLEIGGRDGTEAFSFEQGATVEDMAAAINLVSDALGIQASVAASATKGAITTSSAGANNDIVLTATQAGEDEGNIRIKYTKGDNSSTSIVYTEATGADAATVEVKLETTQWAAATADRMDDDSLTQTAAVYTIDFNDDYDSGNAADITLTAAAAGGQYHDINVIFDNDESVAAEANKSTATFDAASKTLTVKLISGVTTDTQIQTTLNAMSEFGAAGGAGGTAVIAQGNTVTQITDGVGDDNNSFDVTANLLGADFNNTDVRIVRGETSEAGTTANFVQRSTTFYGDATGTATPANNVFSITVKDYDSQTGAARRFLGANGGDITVDFSDTSGAAGNVVDISYDEATNTLLIKADFAGGIDAVTAAELATALNTGNYRFDGYTPTGGAAGDLKISEVFEVAIESASGADNIGTDVATNQDSQVLGDKTSGLVQMTATVKGATTAGTLTITARAGGSFDGARANTVFVSTTDTASGANDVDSVTFNEYTGELHIALDLTTGVATADIVTALNAATSNQGNRLVEMFDFVATATPMKGAATYAAGATVGKGDGQATAGVGYNETSLVYDDEAKAAQAALNGFNAGNDTAFIITAATAGTAYNDVSIVFDNAENGNGNVASIDYDSSNKVLTISVDDAATTIAKIVEEITADGTFTAALDQTVDTTNDGSGVIAMADITGGAAITGNTYNTGGDAGTLYIYAEDGKTTAQDVINALSADGNERANSLFSISNSIDSDGTGLLFGNTYTNALTGGVTGGGIAATAQEVVDAITAHSAVSGILGAALATGNTGITAVAAFEEYADYGSASAGTRIQFLGEKDSQNIRFVASAGNSLGVDTTTDPQVMAKSQATLAAENADASITFRAVSQGNAYDDTIVRFEARAATQSQDTVVYDQRISQATAFLDLGGTDQDIQIIAVERSDAYNNVAIYVVDTGDVGAADDPTVAYDSTTKQLTIDIDATHSADDVIDAINASGLFTAAVSYTNDDTNDGSGVALTTSSTVAAGNTRTSGGHESGVLLFTIENGVTDADGIVALLNNDDYASNYFTAQTYGTVGTGLVDAENDTNKAVTSGGIASQGTFIINLETDANGIVQTSAQELVTFLDTSAEAAAAAISASLAEGTSGNGTLAATSADLTFATMGTNMQDAYASGEITAVNGKDARYTVTAKYAGTLYDDVTIVYENDAVAGSETAEYNSTSKVLTVHVENGVTTANEVETAIENDLGDYFEVTQSGAGTAAVNSDRDTGTLSGGRVDQGSVEGAALLGNEDQASTGLTFLSNDYGSEAFVSVKSLSGTFELADATGASADRSWGTDVSLRINGIRAVGEGLKATLNTSSLDLSFFIDSTVAAGEQLNFNITGGGAQFQLGPDVVSNQQARLGISSVNTAKLGGPSGRMYELRSGRNKSLDGDIIGAANVVEEVITQITTLRGRLGAFQRTTLESNVNALGDTLEALAAAESSIRDADFAAESAKLTRAQILVQSGLSVLGIANSNPQNVLSLLR